MARLQPTRAAARQRKAGMLCFVVVIMTTITATMAGKPGQYCKPGKQCAKRGGYCAKECDDILCKKGCQKGCKCCNPDKFKGPYPKNMIWGDDQCKVITNYYGPTLFECQATCAKVTSCTAINFLTANNPHSPLGWPTSDCILRACPRPVPSPNWPNFPYNGYSLIPERFTGPFNKIWSDAVCRRHINIWYYSLSECMNKCEATSDCTAIIYQQESTGFGSTCILCDCPFPVPEPDLSDPPYLGYSLSTGFMFGPDEKTTTMGTTDSTTTT